MVILQVTDTVVFRTEASLCRKDDMRTVSLCKPRKRLDKDQAIFNDVSFSLKSDTRIKMIQQKKMLGVVTTTNQEAFQESARISKIPRTELSTGYV